MTMPGAERCASPPPVRERSDVHGDERGQREEGDRDDAQRQVLASFGVLGGKLPGQRSGGGHFDHRIQSEADQAEESATPPAHSATMASMTL